MTCDHHRALLQLASAGLLATLAGPGLAAPEQYVCTIVEARPLEGDGRQGAMTEPPIVGRRFVVNRTSGVLVGPDGAFWARSDSKFAVMVRGDTQDAFVSMAVTMRGNQVASAVHVTVHEPHAGSLKPFVVVSGRQVASGLCE